MASGERKINGLFASGGRVNKAEGGGDGDRDGDEHGRSKIKKGDSVIACEGRVIDCVELADELGFGHTGEQR